MLSEAASSAIWPQRGVAGLRSARACGPECRPHPTQMVRSEHGTLAPPTPVHTPARGGAAQRYFRLSIRFLKLRTPILQRRLLTCPTVDFSLAYWECASVWLFFWHDEDRSPAQWDLDGELRYGSSPEENMVWRIASLGVYWTVRHPLTLLMNAR